MVKFYKTKDGSMVLGPHLIPSGTLVASFEGDKVRIHAIGDKLTEYYYGLITNIGYDTGGGSFAACTDLDDFIANLSPFFVKASLVNGGPSEADMINMTYDQLTAAVTGSTLIPGMQYRITDYSTTTVQENTQSTGHQFDIIVTADSTDKLNENARAIHTIKKQGVELLSWFEHSKSDYPERYFYVDSVVIEGLTLYRWVSYEELNFASGRQYLLTEMRDVSIGDAVWGFQLIDDDIYRSSEYEEGGGTTKIIINVGEGYMSEQDYFANSKLEAWKLKYCLDNDTDRFAWADDVNGKGVIYRMIDEFNNDVPYDFKNIQFKRELTDGELDLDSGIDTWVYTFTMSDLIADKIVDISLKQNTEYNDDEGQYRQCSDNVIKEAILDFQSDGLIRIQLNDNVFLNIFDNNVYCYYFGCYANTFGNNCISNTFGNACYRNTFRDTCSSNTLGDNCYSNTFGSNCYYNTFGSTCIFNTFGNHCNSNKFGNNCYYNTFGNNCISNTFGSNCYYNTFGSDCYYNLIGEGLQYAFVKSLVCGKGGSAKKDWTTATDLYNKGYCIEISGFRTATNVATTNTWRYYDATGTEIKGTF